MFVYRVCCVGNGLCDGLINRSEESYRKCASVCDTENSKRGSIAPIRAAVPQNKKPSIVLTIPKILKNTLN